MWNFHLCLIQVLLEFDLQILHHFAYHQFTYHPLHITTKKMRVVALPIEWLALLTTLPGLNIKRTHTLENCIEDVEELNVRKIRSIIHHMAMSEKFLSWTPSDGLSPPLH